MKLLQSKIKRWDCQNRLEELEWRLKEIQSTNMAGWTQEEEDDLDECLQIVNYWLKHMEKPEVPKKEKKKSVNLWENQS